MVWYVEWWSYIWNPPKSNSRPFHLISLGRYISTCHAIPLAWIAWCAFVHRCDECDWFPEALRTGSAFQAQHRAQPHHTGWPCLWARHRHGLCVRWREIHYFHLKAVIDLYRPACFPRVSCHCLKARGRNGNMGKMEFEFQHGLVDIKCNILVSK